MKKVAKIVNWDQEHIILAHNVYGVSLLFLVVLNRTYVYALLHIAFFVISLKINYAA